MLVQIKRLRIPKRVKELVYSNNILVRQQAEEISKNNMQKNMLKKGIYIDKDLI